MSGPLQHNNPNSPTASSPHNEEDSAHHDRCINPLRDPQDKRLPRIVGPGGMVIFGVTGDLAQKKLLLAIYDLTNCSLLPVSSALVDYGRREWSKQDLEDYVRTTVEQGARTDFHENVWQHLAEGTHFITGTFTDDEAFNCLAAQLGKLDRPRGTAGSWAYYLSIPPASFPNVCHQLGRSGLTQSGEDYWRRVIIKRPFGHDLASAQELNRIVNSVSPEDAMFHIDHYLGKETVRNILVIRSASQLSDPIWDSHYIDHVQITMAEDIGLGGRAGYYDDISAAHDVVQSHLLQLLALVATEEPIALTPEELQAEKIKVLCAIEPVRPFSRYTAHGQYTANWRGSNSVLGLRDEEGFDPGFTTETYAACTLQISSRHWAGVPFYLHTGKRLGHRVTKIALVFESALHLPLAEVTTTALGQNAMIIRVQPDEGVLTRFGSKVPGSAIEARDINMGFSYSEVFIEQSPEAYGRLILDALLDEANPFPTNGEVELSWKIPDPIIEYWTKRSRPEGYPVGSRGPSSTNHILERDGRVWRRP